MILSIIITHYKTPELLRLCLDSLRSTTKNIDKEIFISDSESNEETRNEIKETYPEVRFCASLKNCGYSAIVNKALLKARGDYILILNSDIILTEKAVEKMTDYLENHPGVGMVGPNLINFDGSSQVSRFRFYTPFTIIYRRTPLGKLKFGKKNIDNFLMNDKPTENTKPYTADWLMGSCIMIRSEAIENVGLLDERFFMYFEDVDWCHRFWDHGYKIIYLPDIKIFHYHIQSSRKKGFIANLTNKYTYTHIKSALLYFLKHGIKKTNYTKNQLILTDK